MGKFIKNHTKRVNVNGIGVRNGLRAGENKSKRSNAESMR
jgi:hypothetical protein